MDEMQQCEMNSGEAKTLLLRDVKYGGIREFLEYLGVYEREVVRYFELQGVRLKRHVSDILKISADSDYLSRSIGGNEYVLRRTSALPNSPERKYPGKRIYCYGLFYGYYGYPRTIHEIYDSKKLGRSNAVSILAAATKAVRKGERGLSLNKFCGTEGYERFGSNVRKLEALRFATFNEGIVFPTKISMDIFSRKVIELKEKLWSQPWRIDVWP